MPDSPLTADEVCTWLSLLGDRGQLQASTIHTYAAALGNWHDTEHRHPDNHERNPLQSNSVRRVLAGIANVQAERAQQRPLSESSERGFPLTLPTLRRYPFDLQQPLARMYRAAAYLGVCLGLRISELLGSSRTPERAIRMEQLSFYKDSAAATPLRPNEPDLAVPGVLQLVLRATKTNHLSSTTKILTVPEAVHAVWEWFRECTSKGRSARALLFQLDNHRPATAFSLTRYLQRRHQAAGLGEVRLTGKSLRRGGASTLAAMGVDEQHIAQLGWAAGSSVWQRYTDDPAVMRQRAIQRSHMMVEDMQQPKTVQ